MCTICNHPYREDIERALMSIGSDSPVTTESIATQFDISLEDLKMHALFHTPLSVSNVSAMDVELPERPSITRKLKLREADALEEVTAEYLMTLRNLGKRINRALRSTPQEDDDQKNLLTITKILTKPTVDLYLGLGNEIRSTVKATAELDRQLNGPKDSTAMGLQALADAITQSK